MKLTDQQKQEARNQLSTWMELKRHPGWEMFEQMAKAEEDQLLAGAARLGQSPSDMALQLGGWRVASAYRTFADRNIQMAKQMLDASDEAEKASVERKHR